MGQPDAQDRNEIVTVADKPRVRARQLGQLVFDGGPFGQAPSRLHLCSTSAELIELPDCASTKSKWRKRLNLMFQSLTSASQRSRPR